MFLNPPFAHPLVGQFAQKLVAHLRAGDVSAAIVLVNNCTETKWFAALAREAAAICFPTGRLQFWKPDRDTESPIQGQAVIYFGPDRSRFCDAFVAFGVVAVIRHGSHGGER